MSLIIFMIAWAIVELIYMLGLRISRLVLAEIFCDMTCICGHSVIAREVLLKFSRILKMSMIIC